MAILAKAMSRPFYVVAESHKFNKIYPLTQKDIPWRKSEEKKEDKVTFVERDDDDVEMNEDMRDKLLTIENYRIRDYTPPEYITLLFTDLGCLTPSAVSDE